MHRDDVWHAIDVERLRLADVLDELTPAEWEHPSLCAGWRVRDVAAHLALSHTGLRSFIVELVRARGNFNRMIHDTARRHAAEPVTTLINEIRAMSGSRRHAPGTTHLDPLLDVLVHSQDIAVPLGRHHPIPTVPAATAANRVWTMGFPFRARQRLRGFLFSATDVSWSVGAGLSVDGPIEAILLLLTGRTIAVPRLRGAGAEALAARPAPVPA